MTTAIPFLEVFAPTFSQSVDLMDSLTGRHARLTHLAIDPHPQVDILGTQAQLKWTIPRGSETLGLTGQSIIVASQTYAPGPALQQFNTELVAMSLTGNSGLVGPIRFNEQAQVHSPGQTGALGPGPVVFPASSFFDVFFRVDDSSFDVFGCLDPLTEKATVSAWPPLGTPYLPPGPCKLYNLSTGQQVGSLDSFTWVWTQPTGTCVDADGDGVFAPPCGNDCDDHDPNNYPGNLENCSDGRDNNCNQLIDCRDPLCLGRACDDGDVCTRPDLCTSAGTCVGPPVDCNDHDPCTLDRCNPNTGQCEHAPVNCDDQNPCTVDRCNPNTGQCEHVPVICDDGNQCTTDACDPTTGACKFTPTVGAPCDDGDRCTTADVCRLFPTGGVVCVGTPVNCDDQNPCTSDSCDPLTGLCVHAEVSCDDQNLCTTDRCNPSTGQCEHVPVNCDDGNQCTADSCDPANGQCVHQPIVGQVCNDGDPCTQGDKCVQIPGDGVVCRGVPVSCDDNNPCTLDRCNPLTGQCEHALVNCDDNNPCTTDRCDPANGACLHVPVNCDDQNQCTLDSCDPATGQCVHQPLLGQTCDDGNACTQGDKCVQTPTGGVVCQGSPLSCDDGNLCTLDECDPHTGACLHVPVNCDDGNSCTADACDPATGLCVHRPIPVQEPEPIKFRDETTILWAPTPDASHWNTYRGTIPAKLLASRLPGAVYDQACFESDDSFGDGPTICTDASNPPLGMAFYYLVSGESACGESDIGHPSAPPGAVIPNTSPCPTPP